MMIDQMIMEARSMGCSDIHITVGMPLMYRINGRLQNAQTNPSDGEIIAMLAELLTDEQRENLERGIDADFAIRTPDGNRQRVNVLIPRFRRWRCLDFQACFGSWQISRVV